VRGEPRSNVQGGVTRVVTRQRDSEVRDQRQSAPPARDTAYTDHCIMYFPKFVQTSKQTRRYFALAAVGQDEAPNPKNG
jgi:hypothetical protein